MRTNNLPTVADELLWDTLSIELQATLKRLFYVGVRTQEQLEAAYARGYSAGKRDRGYEI